MSSQWHVVIGASGGIGHAVCDDLSDRGLPVRAVSRNGAWSPLGGEALAADVSTAEGAAAAVKGAAVVYQCAQPAYTRWAQEFPPLMKTITDATARAQATLVMADNLYMYEPVDGPIREDSPTRPSSVKGQLRLDLAQGLLDRHARGDLPVAIGRASDYFGPHGPGSTPGALICRPLAKRSRPRWLGDLDQPHSLHYLPDVAAALVTLGTSDAAPGRAWILPAGPARTGREWIALAQAAAGIPVGKPGVVSPAMNRLAGLFIPMVGALNEIMYQFTAPFVVDDSGFRQTFAEQVTVTQAEEAWGSTMAWFREQRAAGSSA
jgi:nucleoside-diphosphate-sugar epimerase